MLYIYLTITGEIILNQQQIPTLRQTQQKKTVPTIEVNGLWNRDENPPTPL